MYIDSHAHYDDERYDEDREKIIAHMKSEGIDYIVNIGADIKTSEKAVKIAKQHDFIYATVGIHPHEVKGLGVDDLDYLYELAQNKKVVAIGEIGLDYYYENSPKTEQREWFVEQIELAKELDMPMVIHSREASEESFKIIKENNAKYAGGVVHCYSSSVEMAKEYIKDDWLLGIGGVITFPNAKKLVQVVKEIPLEYLLLETDAPYLTPVPNRGKRNDSTNLKYIAEKIAEIKGTSVEEVAEVTSKNAKILYGIE